VTNGCWMLLFCDVCLESYDGRTVTPRTIDDEWIERLFSTTTKSGGYRNRKKWTCQTCLTGFGREEENWTFLPFQSRHVMTRCKNGHVFHPTPLPRTTRHNTTYTF
jgi:hypothetical protein